LAKLPRGHAPQLGPGSRSVNEPFYAYGKSGSVSFPGFFTKPSALWVLVFLVATIGVFYLPELQKFHFRGDVQAADGAVDPQRSTAISTNTQEDAAPALEPNTGIEVNAPPVLTLESNEAQPVLISSVAQQPMEGVSATGGGAMDQQTALAPATDGVSDLAVAGVLVLKARGPTWVKVIDAKGTVQLMKILVAGETTRVGGASPLSVVVGAADTLDVLVRGVPFDLQALAKDNVARFEVK
jgi:cytoskeleton protein RodZ